MRADILVEFGVVSIRGGLDLGGTLGWATRRAELMISMAEYLILCLVGSAAS